MERNNMPKNAMGLAQQIAAVFEAEYHDDKLTLEKSATLIAAYEAEKTAGLVAALADCMSGFAYIRNRYGTLHGVGWDRIESYAPLVPQEITHIPKENLGIELCPECGSGDVAFCSISVRPYCRECKHWGSVNYGTRADSIKEWNDRSARQALAGAEKGGE